MLIITANIKAQSLKAFYVKKLILTTWEDFLNNITHVETSVHEI